MGYGQKIFSLSHTIMYIYNNNMSNIDGKATDGRIVLEITDAFFYKLATKYRILNQLFARSQVIIFSK